MFGIIADVLKDESCRSPSGWIEATKCWGLWAILQPSIVSAVVAPVITTGLGAIIIARLSSVWARSQKRKELDLATLEQFQRLYGEFFALYHLWDDFKQNKFANVEKAPDDFVKDIIQRAYRTEGNMEAVLTRIAAEKKLSSEEIDSLGKFRQEFQRVRKYVSKDIPLNWDRDFHPEYASVKIHAARVSDIILFSKARSRATRSLQILDITSNRYETRQSSRWVLSDKELAILKREQQMKYESTLAPPPRHSG